MILQCRVPFVVDRKEVGVDRKALSVANTFALLEAYLHNHLLIQVWMLLNYVPCNCRRRLSQWVVRAQYVADYRGLHRHPSGG